MVLALEESIDHCLDRECDSIVKVSPAPLGVLLIVLLGFCWKLTGSYDIVSTALPHNQSAIKSTDLPSIRWDNYP
ncbi:BDF_1d_G0043820.mRNA.1.CDS.1 [Saccharomyces cerevisiae]|nr:BDF_1d_G0043820.mRNA.1.CDS.1 [Saccharomyces cerevisiae]CAI7293709.1 BDF_1d_G0043820.mRNA.1.CDS.1 [Saccharomyces cerevisiae]